MAFGARLATFPVGGNQIILPFPDFIRPAFPRFLLKAFEPGQANENGTARKRKNKQQSWRPGTNTLHAENTGPAEEEGVRPDSPARTGFFLSLQLLPLRAAILAHTEK